MFCVTLQQVTDAYENLNKHPISIIKIIAKVKIDRTIKQKFIHIILDVVCHVYRYSSSSIG
jgi:hypothetical protein